jgi:hypothetical protein
LSFSWFAEPVVEFAAAFRGVFWHDTWAVVVPPLPHPFDMNYVPSKDFKTLVIGLTFGRVLVLDPSTNTWREPTPTEYAAKLTRVGVYHRCAEWMDWHWDPFVNSLGIDGRFVYPQLGFASASKPYELRVVNPTDLIVFADATFWVIKFPNEIDCPIWGGERGKCDVEELFWRYMRSRVMHHMAAGKMFWEGLRTPQDVDKFVSYFREKIGAEQ